MTDCANWPAGVYLLNITNAQGQKVQKKVVKVL
ncbi:MAG: T9SS type A sorting domain-containing protein [Bacteroidales bacterium]|nr:T9SS type A sorting domain-containing protein [Bacteroidales bacterium]